MSTFVVALREIGRVRPHPNADRLDLAEVEGLTFQFVVPRGAYRPGDPVIYFPIDALLPDALAVRLGAKNYLAGPLMNRVKTARLRGAGAAPSDARPAVRQAALAGMPRGDGLLTRP